MTCNEMAFFHSNIFMLQTPRDDDGQHNHHPSTSLPPILPPQEFHGVASLMGNRSQSNMPFSSTGIDLCEEINNNGDHDELSDEESQMGEKKRRLNMEQVKTLEKNFELGNKLEPERKMQLARALGLQPRQIAIWFQNRRARWKTKQLEKDYEVLKKQFDAVKAENDSLQTQNQRLLAQIMALKSREPTESINLNKETEGSSSNRSENSSEIKLHISITPAMDSPFPTHPTTSTNTASRPLFPSSSIRSNNNGGSQLFQNSSRQEIQFPKMDHQTVKEESSLSNMFCTMDDHTGFWPWLEQQNYN